MSQAKMLRLPNRQSAPLYSSVYQIGTVLNENDQGRWYQIGDRSKTAIDRVDWINPDQFVYVKNVISMFDKIKSNIGKSSAGFEEETPY